MNQIGINQIFGIQFKIIPISNPFTKPGSVECNRFFRFHDPRHNKYITEQQFVQKIRTVTHCCSLYEYL